MARSVETFGQIDDDAARGKVHRWHGGPRERHQQRRSEARARQFQQVARTVVVNGAHGPQRGTARIEGVKPDQIGVIVFLFPGRRKFSLSA